MDIDSQHTAHRTGLDWSGSHWFHLAVGLAAIWIYLLGGIAQTKVGAIPEGFSIEQDSFPVKIGDHTVHSASELEARAAAEGTEGEFVLHRPDGTEAFKGKKRRANTRFHDLVTRLNGIFFLAVTLIVFAPRANMVPARDLYWACLLYGLAVMIGGVYAPTGGKVWPGALLPLTRIVSLVILPTLMLHVGLTFPRRSFILDRHRWVMPAVTLVGLLLAAWYFIAWLRWFEGEGGEGHWDAIDLPRRLSGLFLAIVFGSGCMGIILSGRHTEQERKREQVKWVLWGIAMGAAPFVFLHGLPLAVFGAPVISINVARMFSMVIPLAFSLAVIRHKFLDVDIIIRRSLIYVLLASMMVGIYALIGIFVGRRVEESWPASGPFVPIVATLVAALLFAPTRRTFGVLIDRVFFKIRYTHAQALTAFQKELRGTTDQQQAATSLERFLKRTLYPASIAVAIRHDDNIHTSGNWPEDQSPELNLHGDERVVAIPATTARPEIEAVDFPRRLNEAGFVIAHELRAEGHRIGAVALGAKRTGRSYVAEDLELLAAVTRETAIRVQRMNLEQDFVDEVVARHHMEEMGRFRTQFFAQFAHDLRSPLTSINWGARNLLDGVVGPVTPQQASYLEGIEASARQLVRLVNNLLEVTRLESGMPNIEFETLDLVHVIEESISKLRATAATTGVRIVVQDPGPAPLNGNAEKLLEVVDNLIENAIRYSPPESTVEVSITSDDSGVTLIVEDAGPGVDLDDIESLFDPYRQGKPSPHSAQQGFGLGLFVVKSWTERMGGTVSVDNRPTGGAQFTVAFPPIGPPGDQELAS